MRKSRREMAIEGCKAKPKTSGDMETGREGSPSKGKCAGGSRRKCVWGVCGDVENCWNPREALKND